MPLTHKAALGKASLALTSLTLLGLAATYPAQAADTGTLNGTFYHAPLGTINSIAQAQAYISGNAPTGTFTAAQTTLEGAGYSGRDTTPVNTFLGADGPSYHGTVSDLQDGIFNLTGSLDAPTAGTFNFSTTSDDGSALFIDGTEVVNNDGIHSTLSETGSDVLSAGLHTVDVVYFNSSNNGIGQAGFSANFGGTTLTSSAPVPEASTTVSLGLLLALGLGGLTLSARWRKAQAD